MNNWFKDWQEQTTRKESERTDTIEEYITYSYNSFNKEVEYNDYLNVENLEKYLCHHS